MLTPHFMEARFVAYIYLYLSLNQSGHALLRTSVPVTQQHLAVIVALC